MNVEDDEIMENKDNILLSYADIMKSFVILLHEKNPNLKISFHVSFEEFGEEYKKGKFVAGAHTQPASPEFILQVSDNFQLPFESYDELDLLCSSWRNNGYDGGNPADISENWRKSLPSDFDVVAISGNPLDKSGGSCQRLFLYVIGGVAHKRENEKKSSFV